MSKIRYIKIEALPLGKMPYRGSSVHSLFELYKLVRRVTYQLKKKNRPSSRRYTLVTYAISTLRKRCTLFGTQGNQTLFRLSADPTPTLQRSSRTFVINVQVQKVFLMSDFTSYRKKQNPRFCGKMQKVKILLQILQNFVAKFCPFFQNVELQILHKTK